MKPAPFDHVAVGSVGEAVGVLAGDPHARILAGGQSLIPLLAQRALRPTVVVDVNGVGLDHIELDVGEDGGDGDRAGVGIGGGRVDVGRGRLRLGALVRQRTLERDPLVARTAPLLAHAARWIGHPAVRHRGTLGGSLAHADPAAELPAVAVALGAEVVAEGPGGRRGLAAARMVSGPFSTVLDQHEVVVEIVVPTAGPGHGAAFCEWAPRHRDRAEAGVGIAVERDADHGCTAAWGALCGAAGVPLDIGDVLRAAVLGVRSVSPSDALLRHVAADVEGVCHEAGVDGDRGALAGALAARALCQAFDRSSAATETRDAA